MGFIVRMHKERNVKPSYYSLVQGFVLCTQGLCFGVFLCSFAQLSYSCLIFLFLISGIFHICILRVI